MAIPEGIAAAKAAFDVSKVALDLVKYPKLDKDAVSARLLELQDLILSAQRALGDALEENRELKAQLADRNRLELMGSKFFFAEGALWHPDFPNYPFCPNCWNANRAMTQLEGPTFSMSLDPDTRHWRCTLHNANFQLKWRQGWPGPEKWKISI